MTSPAQLSANRDNARLSSGPRSPEGKARSSQNSFQHGFRAKSPLLPGEDPAEFQDLVDQLYDHFDPRDLTEFRCVREMADAEWRLTRVRDTQTQLLSDKILALQAERPDADNGLLQALAFDDLTTNSRSLSTLMRYETQFQRQYDKAYTLWTKYQDGRSRRQDTDFRQHLDAFIAPPPVLTSLRETLAARPEGVSAALAFTPPTEPVDPYVPLLPNEAISVPAAGPQLVPDTPAEPKEPSRTRPCPCGSGKKYKHCCAPDAKSPKIGRK